MTENPSAPTTSDAPTRKQSLTGTHRTRAPEETIARVSPLLADFGITRVANLTGLDRIGIPVVMVCRPNARSSAVFHGKGINLAAAKASGIMEAIETWHAERVRLPLRLASLSELGGGDVAADVGGMARSAAGRFDADLPILWVEGDDLIGGRRRWVPFEAVHMDSTLRETPGGGCFAASTNGLASGNDPLEATSHALCEVIERDATSLWRLRRSAQRDAMRVDLSSVDDEDCRSVLAQLAAAELDVAVWDVTTDVGVPAFQCLTLDRTGEIGHLGQGSGCHPVAAVALLRALIEAVQVRTTYIVGSREDIYPEDYSRETLDARSKSARFMMRPVESMRQFGAIASYQFDDLDREVAWLSGRLEAAGLGQAIVVDLGDPTYGIPVVRVIVPGLEGSDHLSDYCPGARARAVERAP